MANPLVAAPKDDTKAFEGIQIAESIDETKKAIEKGDWAAGVLGATGAALDALGMAMDPFGAILSAGVGWLIEHVGPLSDALDELTGDPDQIKAHSETWKNVSTELASIKTELADLIKKDTAEWAGEAGDAYRKRGEDVGNLIAAAEKAASGASEGVGTAGEVVGAVRTLVRDIIADLVGHLVSWALQVLATLGIAMAWVVPQVINAVAKTAAQIADITKKLVGAMQKLTPLLKKLGDGFKDAADALKKIKSDSGKADGPKPTPGGKDGDRSGPPPNEKGGPSNDKGGPDSTSSQSTDGPGPKGDGPGSNNPPPRNDPPGNSQGNDGPGATGSQSTNGSRNNGPAQTDSQGARNQQPNPRSPNKSCTTGDPIDVSTGQMLMAEVDARFETALPVEISRTHYSSYRLGRWFGRSWVSTLDERLEVDGSGLSYVAADGTLQHFPHPTTNAPVYSENGPRRSLSRADGGGYTIEDTERGCRFYFPPGTSVRPLAAILDDGGHRIDFEYNGIGVPTAIRHSDGYHVRVESTDDRVTGLYSVAQDGTEIELMRYGYTDGRLTEVINPSGQPLRYEYDADGRIVRWVDRNDVWYRFTYDEAGRCVRGEGAGGFLSCSIQYDTENRITYSTDSLGHRTAFHMNEAGQVIKEVDPLGNAIESEWDAHDRLLSRTDPLGRVTSYEYDEFGQLVAIVRPDGSTLGVQEDGTDIVVSAEDDGTTQWRTYGRAEFPDPAQAQVGVATPLRYEPTEAESPLVTVFARDAFGRTVDGANAAGGRVVTNWSTDGRPVSRRSPLGGRKMWRYDGEGNEVERYDELGQITRTEYGPFDRPVAVTDVNGARTVYGYDTELRMVSVTNPNGLVWRYEYDPAGRLVEETDFDGRTLHYTYDAAGQLRTSTNGMGEVTEYEHDLLGQVIERRTPSGSTTYRYDSLGRLTSATSPDAVLSYERDEFGRVTAETVNGRTTTYEYADDGTWKRRRTPSGVESTWTYDQDELPRSLSTVGHTVVFRHDSGGKEVQRSVDDAVVVDQTFTPEHRLATQTVTSGDGRRPHQRQFEYRPDGYLVGMHSPETGAVRLNLDQKGRVADVVASDRGERYRYDAMGNVVETPLGACQYEGNTLLRVGPVSFQYDQQGRMILRRVGQPGHDERTWLFTWDAQDRMTGVITPDGARWRYLYDPIGRRIAKQRFASGASGEPAVDEQIDYVWDGPLLIEQVHSAVGREPWVTTWEYHPLDDRPLTQVDSSGSFYSIITDMIGTPTEVFSASGEPVWRGRPTLWGKATEANAVTPLRFPGQYADPETDLHYNVYRYYDPVVGRYVSQDPLGLEPALNPVSYVVNPHRTADPLGLMDCTGGGSGPPNRPGGGHDPGQNKPTPPPVKPKPENLKGNPVQQPPKPDTRPSPLPNYPAEGKPVDNVGTVYRADDRPPEKIKEDGGFDQRRPQSAQDMLNDMSGKGPSTWQQEHISGKNPHVVSADKDPECGGYASNDKYIYKVEPGEMYKFDPERPGKPVNPNPTIYADTPNLNDANRIGVVPNGNRVSEVDFNKIPYEDIKQYKGPGDTDWKDMPK